MRIPRIYCPQSLSTGSVVFLAPQAARHVHQVLRLKAGHELQLFDGNGGEYQATIESADRKQVSALVGERLPAGITESPLSIHLGIAISKGDRMDWVVQKATELGATAITPLFTRRVEVRLNAERRAKKQQHWQQVIISACEQCGRSHLPALHPAETLDNWLTSVEGEQKWVLAPGQAKLDSRSKPASVVLLIGPEGGLEDAEIQQACEQSFTPLSLGPRILRTETAPVATLAILQHLWGDM